MGDQQQLPERCCGRCRWLSVQRFRMCRILYVQNHCTNPESITARMFCDLDDGTDCPAFERRQPTPACSPDPQSSESIETA